MIERERPMRKLSFGEKALSTACAAALALACMPATALANVGGTTPGNSPVVSFGKTYSDALASGDDVDYYEVVVPTNGKLTVSFGKNYASNSSRWDVTLLSSDLSHEYFSHRYENDNSKTETSVLGVKAGTYYVMVESYSRAAGVNYTLKADFAESGAWEEEGNDTPLEAKGISLGKKVKGTIAGSDDEDWYKFSVGSKGYYSIDFGKAYSADAEEWHVMLYNFDQSKQLTDAYVKNDSSKTAKVVKKLSKGTYYVKVTDPYSWDSCGGTYSLGLSKFTAPAATKITKTKGISNGGKVYWKTKKGISGYQVQLSDNKSFSSPYTQTTKKASMKGVKFTSWLFFKGEKKYVRVRTFKEAANDTIYSKWSKVKSFTCK